MELTKALQKHGALLFEKVGLPALAAVAKRWPVRDGFTRSSNSTDHKTLKDQPMARNALDKLEGKDGGETNCIVINTMQHKGPSWIFASYINAVLTAHRFEELSKNPKRKDGKLQLIDSVWTANARKVGLQRIAEENASGKAIKESNRRVWYGLSALHEPFVEAFAKDVDEFPPAFVGTEESNKVGSAMLPIDLPAGTFDGQTSTLRVWYKLGSVDTAEEKIGTKDRSGHVIKTNKVLDTFDKISSTAIPFDRENDKYCLLAERAAARKVGSEEKTPENAPAPPPAEAAPAEPKSGKRARK